MLVAHVSGPLRLQPRAICPNSLRRRFCISEETGGWLVSISRPLNGGMHSVERPPYLVQFLPNELDCDDGDQMISWLLV